MEVVSITEAVNITEVEDTVEDTEDRVVKI
jgi:hypothetical protein